MEGKLIQTSAAAGYPLETSTGENHSERVQFLRAERGFRVNVDEIQQGTFLDDHRGRAGRNRMQEWLSAFGKPQTEVDAFANEWSEWLKEMFQAEEDAWDVR